MKTINNKLHGETSKKKKCKERNVTIIFRVVVMFNFNEKEIEQLTIILQYPKLKPVSIHALDLKIWNIMLLVH